MLEAIKYSDGNLTIIDQLLLPYKEEYVRVRTTEDGWHAIRDMRVRGAPAIAIVAALALASDISILITDNRLPTSANEVKDLVVQKLSYLLTSRPTAVNLSDASSKLGALVAEHSNNSDATGHSTAVTFIQAAEAMLAKDIQDNQNIGRNGSKWIVENALGPDNSKAAVLTHCNTGSLATAGYGTALGVVRSLASNNALRHAYCTETRPYNQGSRLTAFELVHERIPATLITDSMAAALLASIDANVNAVVVGADRVAANGDTANKIGTYGLAVLAKHHGVKFLVAAPRTTIDLATKSGSEITIEERSPTEVTKIKGSCENERAKGNVAINTISIAADGINVWNPAFDITPSALIDGIITEVCVVEKDSAGHFPLHDLFST